MNLVTRLKDSIVSQALEEDPAYLPNAEEPPLWNYDIVTERQLVLDCILLMQGNQSETFRRLSKSQVKKKIAKQFELRRPIQVLHLSPKMLKRILDQFLEMSEVVERINYFINGLKSCQNTLGTVI